MEHDFSLKQSVETDHIYATRQAFLLLFHRLLQQQSNLEGIIAVTLEQATTNLHTIGCDFWLMEDGRLTLKASSFSTTELNLSHSQQRFHFAHDIAKAKVIQHSTLSESRYTGVGVPLLQGGQLLGVLSLYMASGDSLSDISQSLLEDFASLVSPVLASIQGEQQIRKYVARQRALVEMSRQITDGLGIDDILEHTLQWANRLCPSEFGRAGLYDPAQNTITNLHSLGLPENQTEIPLQRCHVFQQIIDTRQSVLVSSDDDRQPAFCMARPEQIRQCLCIPLLYQENLLGVLQLINKLGAPFSQDDIDVLNIVGEIAGIALNNAILHAQTVDLINEQERMYKMAIQRERLAIIGRLMRSLAHEINNPLQAVRGALVLAQEDNAGEEDLRTYFDIMNREVERVVQLLQRMRNIYRESGDFVDVDINQLVQNVIVLARKELNWKHTRLRVTLSDEPPIVWGQTGQLHIALLNIILALSERIANEPEKNLFLKTHLRQQDVLILLGVRASLDEWRKILGQDRPEDISEIGFGLQFSQAIVESHNGRITVIKSKKLDSIVVVLPLAQGRSQTP